MPMVFQILSWEFCTRSHEIFLRRTSVAPQVPVLLSVLILYLFFEVIQSYLATPSLGDLLVTLSLQLCFICRFLSWVVLYGIISALLMLDNLMDFHPKMYKLVAISKN